MNSVNEAFLLSLGVVAFGFILRKIKFLSLKDGKTISQILIKVTLPAVILTTVPKIELSVEYAVMPLIALAATAIVLLSGFLFFKKTPPDYKGMALITIITFNVGNFAYPIVENLWGKEGLAYAAMFDMGNAFIIFTLCYIIVVIYSTKTQQKSGNLQKPSTDIHEKLDADEKEQQTITTPSELSFKLLFLKILKNIPLWAYFVGLGMNLGGLEFTGFTLNFLEILSKANMALALLCLGLLLEFKFEKQVQKLMIKVLVIRYVFVIVLGVLCYYFLPFTEFMRIMVVILLLLPIGMSIISFGVEYQYNETAIATICNISILISFPLIWIVTLLLA